MKKIKEWLDTNLYIIWGCLMLMIITIGLVGLVMKLTLWIIGMGGTLL